ncbi:hypothetical protein GALMADRAFT_251582 [Galerina marginata CBS 339.88]|uniref:RING-type E3 ubiquitin transferase n=1 Tax=Galerina marginata (strain CBS 339.88) TaxID=685588 RepID=A0A067SSB5_GALM3|nr:hypothetical protein GALMADRAFT_251582 [Galerina marginata CBS 339.88]
MSSEVVTQSRASTTEPTRGSGKRTNKPRGGNPNNRGSNRNARYAGNKQGKDALNVGKPSEEAVTIDNPDETHGVVEQLGAVALSESGEMEVCWICAEPVKYYSLSECNHRTCHVCAIRLRALYKKTDCTFCKEPQPHVIFTVSPDAPYSSFAPESIPFKDAKLSVSFETQEMMEDTLILLRFNCADPECDYIGNGWGDLRLHARATHGKLMCDLCIRHKKVFSHEHTLYAPAALAAHLPSMGHRPGKGALKEPPEGGVHPLCAFCRECLFGDDELYTHMREKHEECFVCKRNEVRDQYFQNYESLERHFNNAHHPCNQPDCLARKFVVFNTPLDLKAHMVEEHGGDMTSRDKKDARRIQADFMFEEVGHNGRHGRRDRERDRDRDRDREPPPHQQQQPQATTSAAARQPPPGGGGRRREGFGGALTEAGPTPAQQPTNADRLTRPSTRPSSTRPPSRPSTPQPNPEVDPAVAERHADFLARLQSLAPNPSTAVPAVKAATRSYRSTESSARDLILTIWNVMDRNLEHTASIVNAFIDLVDEEEKKQDLLSSWKGFAIEQRRQFPDLTPTALGAGYAGITSGRVLNAKHATAARSSQSQQVWNRVALAASNSSINPSSLLGKPSSTTGRPQDRFPALAGSSSGPAIPAAAPALATPLYRQPQRTTPWSTSSAQPSVLRAQTTYQAPARLATPKQAPPKLSNALFPELPTSSTARSKPQVSGNVSLKNILGTSSAPTVAAWGAGGNAPPGDAVQENENEASEETSGAAATTAGAGKGKKSKGKQKQTLFTLGSFPT